MKLGDGGAKFSLFPAPDTACRCGAAIPCDGTICGGKRLVGSGDSDGRAAPEASKARSNAAAAAAAAAEAMAEEDPGGAGGSSGGDAVVTVDNHTSKAHSVLQAQGPPYPICGASVRPEAALRCLARA